MNNLKFNRGQIISYKGDKHWNLGIIINYDKEEDFYFIITENGLIKQKEYDLFEIGEISNKKLFYFIGTMIANLYSNN
jgi:hypothetical protein